ncbi:MAG: 16S rRNA (cytidine(1402)-2'-O)-methyltransferase [Halanaerobiaceae bacterium]|jgi:16S rRNA (cytidine1402-2'-O)-methyltransferase|nr:16S rRNA (cytidine(1402)-2'-O)-methyltransferase [Halanaerobiaceae bacterium]
MAADNEYVQKGTLYVCGTPIGNLEDMTFRAIKVLEGVDLIAAEDTRRTIKLLNYFRINNRIESYHEHNESKKAKGLIKLLKEGKAIALVSDAGMPGISDPGQILIRHAIEEGIEVVPVPGPTAAVSALVVSGLDTGKFVFEGFLARKGRERKEQLERIAAEPRTIIIYESPYRLKESLKELQAYINNRKIALVRELTKIHEEKLYGDISSVLSEIGDREIRGEIVIVIEGNKTGPADNNILDEMDILTHVKLYMDQGKSKKEAIKKVAEERAIPKSRVYKEAIAIDVDNGKDI